MGSPPRPRQSPRRASELCWGYGHGPGSLTNTSTVEFAGRGSLSPENGRKAAAHPPGPKAKASSPSRTPSRTHWQAGPGLVGKGPGGRPGPILSAGNTMMIMISSGGVHSMVVRGDGGGMWMWGGTQSAGPRGRADGTPGLPLSNATCGCIGRHTVTDDGKNRRAPICCAAVCGDVVETRTAVVLRPAACPYKVRSVSATVTTQFKLQRPCLNSQSGTVVAGCQRERAVESAYHTCAAGPRTRQQ